MPQRKPISIESGALDWQVFARRGNHASLSLRIYQRAQEAPGTVYTRLVSEKNGRILQKNPVFETIRPREDNLHIL